LIAGPLFHFSGHKKDFHFSASVHRLVPLTFALVVLQCLVQLVAGNDSDSRDREMRQSIPLAPKIGLGENKANSTMASDTTLERPLPHNLEAERSIPGAFLVYTQALNAAVEKLRSEDFFLSQHRQIFQRMIQLGEKQQAIDTVTLMEDLGRRGELEAAGGVAYLSQLADGLPRVTNVEHYARIVKEKAVLRSLIFSASAIQEQALAAGDDADVILDRAESAIFQLAEDRVRTGLIGVKDLVREGFELLEKIFSEGRRITGLATGYPGLDNEVAGLQNSELIILAARPSMGKTALAL